MNKEILQLINITTEGIVFKDENNNEIIKSFRKYHHINCIGIENHVLGNSYTINEELIDSITLTAIFNNKDKKIEFVGTSEECIPSYIDEGRLLTLIHIIAGVYIYGDMVTEGAIVILPHDWTTDYDRIGSKFKVDFKTKTLRGVDRLEDNYSQPHATNKGRDNYQPRCPSEQNLDQFGRPMAVQTSINGVTQHISTIPQVPMSIYGHMGQSIYQHSHTTSTFVCNLEITKDGNTVNFINDGVILFSQDFVTVINILGCNVKDCEYVVTKTVYNYGLEIRELTNIPTGLDDAIEKIIHKIGTVDKSILNQVERYLQQELDTPKEVVQTLKFFNITNITNTQELSLVLQSKLQRGN